MIIKDILETRKEARKDVNRVIEFNILTLVYGELETAAKRNGQDVLSTEDSVVFAAIAKMIKSNNEVIGLSGEVSARKFVQENVILSKYLPTKLTEDEVKAILENSVFGSVKEGIAALDKEAPGLYDKASAVNLIKSLL